MKKIVLYNIAVLLFVSLSLRAQVLPESPFRSSLAVPAFADARTNAALAAEKASAGSVPYVGSPDFSATAAYGAVVAPLGSSLGKKSSLRSVGGVSAAEVHGFAAISATPVLSEQGLAVLPSEAVSPRRAGFIPNPPDEDGTKPNGANPIGDAWLFLFACAAAFAGVKAFRRAHAPATRKN